VKFEGGKLTFRWVGVKANHIAFALKLKGPTEIPHNIEPRGNVTVWQVEKEELKRIFNKDTIDEIGVMLCVNIKDPDGKDHWHYHKDRLYVPVRLQ